MSQATALLADAETSIKAGDWDAAIEQLESLKQEQPAEPEVYRKLAESLAIRGRFQSVVSIYLELIRVLVESEQLGPADDVVTRVLGLRPESSEARERRIEIENRRGNTARAVALSRELARLCIDQGDGERSIRLLQDAQKHEPGNLDISLELAEMFVSHGHIQDGANQYRKVANAFQEIGNISKAAEAYRRMKVVQSDDPEVLLTLGRLYTELGKLDEAEQEFRSVLRHDLDHEQALLQLGLVCQLKGRFRSGILAFNKVLQNNPSLVEAKRKLGELHHSQGMMPEAVDFFLKAAQGYLEGEEREGAIECFQIVLSVDENNAPAQQGLTNLGAPVLPKAFEAPQPPAPVEESPPEPAPGSAISSPEPVAGNNPSMERTERLPATDFEASSEPDPPKADTAAPKKTGVGNTRRATGGLTGGMRKGLVAPGGGDKPMLGGDKPVLGRSRGGIREGLGKKVLGGGPMMGGGADKPMLGSPSGPARRPNLERPEAAAVVHTESPESNPLEDFSEDMALENVFSAPVSAVESVGHDSSDNSLFDSSSSDDNGEMDFGSLGDDLFDSSAEPSAHARGVVLGAVSFDSEDDDESGSSEVGLRPEYAGEVPVFEDEIGDDLFDFGANPDGPKASSVPTLAMGADLFDDDSFGEDLFGDESPSSNPNEGQLAENLFSGIEAGSAEDVVDQDSSGLFDGDTDPFGSLFDESESSVEASAETLGGLKGSLEFPSDEPSAASSSLSDTDFGSLFDEPVERSGDSGRDDLFTGVEFDGQSDASSPDDLSSGLFSGDSNSSDLFQDDGLFSEHGQDAFPSSSEDLGETTLFDTPSLVADESFLDGPGSDSFDDLSLMEASGSAVSVSEGEFFASNTGAGLFDEFPQEGAELTSLDGSSLFDPPDSRGGLFDDDSSSGGGLFSESAGETDDGLSRSVERDDEFFATGGERGLFDEFTDSAASQSESDTTGLWGDENPSSGLFDEAPDEEGDLSMEPVGDLFSSFGAGDSTGEDTLFSSGFSESSEFAEPLPLDLELPMPLDEDVVASSPDSLEPERTSGGLFEDDAVGDLFAGSDFEEAPLEFAIPDPDIVREEAAADVSLGGEGFSASERSLEFTDDVQGDDLFADNGYPEEQPLEFDIPAALPEDSLVSPDTFFEVEEIAVPLPREDALLDHESLVSTDEPLGFEIPSLNAEPLIVDFGQNESPEEDLFASASAAFEPVERHGSIEDQQPEEESSLSSAEEETDEVLTMLEMTLPSIELPPEDNILSGTDIEVGDQSVEQGGFNGSDFPHDGTEGDFGPESFGDESAGAVGSSISLEEQLELVQTNQADALEATLVGADVASKIAAFRKALEETPDNLILRVRLADIHLKYGLLEDAVVQYRQVLRRNSDSIPLLHRVIQAEFWNENYVEAGNSLLALAELHLNQGEPHDALDALQSVLSLDPLHFEARQALVSVFTSLEESKLAAHHLRQLAETALTKGEISGAIVAFQQLLEISEDPTFEERLAQIYESQGDVEKALASFQSLLGRYRAEGRWEEAARVTERIVELDPSLLEEREGLIALYHQLGLNAQVVEQQYHLARLYQEAGETSRAVALFEDVIKVQTENFEARRHLVDAYLGLGRVSSALEQAESLTEHYLDTKDHNTAISLYSRLVEADPENVELQERLVKFYGLAGDPENAKSRWIAISFQHEKSERFERAAEALQKALELDENQLDLLQRLAVLYAEKIGDHQAALICLRKLFGLAPEKTEAVKMYIDLLLRAEQVSEAGQVLQKLEQAGGESVEIKASVIASLKTSVEANPGDLKTRFNYGELCYHLGDLDHAIEQFQQTRRHPDYELMSYNMLGLCFASKRGYMMLDLAIKQFKKGLETKGRLEQDYLETRYNLAMVLYQNSRPAEALAELKECYNVDIAYRDVRSWIQKIESEQASSGA